MAPFCTPFSVHKYTPFPHKCQENAKEAKRIALDSIIHPRKKNSPFEGEIKFLFLGVVDSTGRS